MKDGLDWKKFQFITQVQTALIGNALAEACESKGQVRREIFSSIAMLNKMQTAFVAAEQIPEAISAHEAACEIANLLCEVDGAELPLWFVRPE